jgi:hypothetical protein
VRQWNLRRGLSLAPDSVCQHRGVKEASEAEISSLSQADAVQRRRVDDVKVRL